MVRKFCGANFLNMLSSDHGCMSIDLQVVRKHAWIHSAM